MRKLPWIGGWLCFAIVAMSVAPLFAQDTAAAIPGEPTESIWWSPPVVLLVAGIVAVLSLIIGLKLNAFLALIVSALAVSLGVGWMITGEPASLRLVAVADALGDSAGKIGIVIAMAAIIGKCMLDSGSADRIVRSTVAATGEKKSSLALMISGFALAVPVFFDTVFFLLVPLARSLYRRTGKNYLRYVMAIATGAAITHTLVPPTPGPLLMAAILGVDIGMMMLIGAAVALPAAIVGLVFSITVDRIMPIEMRALAVGETPYEPLPEEKLPSLGVSLLPVLLPVGLILAGTIASTLADAEDRARLVPSDVKDYAALRETFAQPGPPAARILASPKLRDDQRERLVRPAADRGDQQWIVGVLNHVLLDRSLYDQAAFAEIPLSAATLARVDADKPPDKPVEIRRMNRLLLEDTYPELIAKHQWNSARRQVSDRLGLWSNPNFALLLAALVAMLTVKRVRHLSWRKLGDDVEVSLMSGGVIILITAAGGAFGTMLRATTIGDTIQQVFSESGASGIGLLLLGFGIASVLKIAQGSSTVAMIIGAGMMAAIMGENRPEFHMVYLATAVGAGSLMGSWMNDSGFWVFAKMSGLTESESLKSWTPLLMVLSLTSLVVTILLSQFLPFYQKI